VKAPPPASLSALYRPSLGLLTDLYQLTMAYAHHRRGTHQQRAVFHLSFRKNPFQGGYTVAAGLAQAIELIEDLRFAEEDVAYLATLSGNDVDLTWASVPGVDYEVKATSNLSTWQALPPAITADGTETTLRITLPANTPKQFFKVEVKR
jgi:nicotinate phosphoribosyltransferase